MRVHQHPISFPLFFILYQLACNLSNDFYLPAIPDIANQFQIDINRVGLTIAAWLCGNACFQWLLGPLVDRYGAKRVMLAGGILFLFSTLGCAFTSSFSLLLLARFVQGIGVSSMMISGYAFIHQQYTTVQAIKMLAWITSISVVAPMAGPLVGGLLLLFGPWQMLFVSILVLALLALCGLCVSMRNDLPEKPCSVNVKQIANDYLVLLKNKAFMSQSFAISFTYAALIAWITGSVAILITGFQLSSFEFGLCQCPIFAGYILGAQMSQKLVNKYNPNRLISIGLLISLFASLALIIGVYQLPYSLSALLIPLSVGVWGAGLIASPLNRGCFQVSTLAKGVTSAMFYMIFMLTGTIASVVVSLCHIQSSFYLCLIMGIAFLIAWICFKLNKVDILMQEKEGMITVH